MTDKANMVAKQKIIDDENERLFGGGQSRSHKKIDGKKVGMTDEEIIASGSGLESSQRVPKWFWSILIVTILIAYGLTVPFWGDRAGSPREWFNWGHVAAFAYIAVFGSFVYFMTMMYGSDDEMDDDAQDAAGDESDSNLDGDEKK